MKILLYITLSLAMYCIAPTANGQACNNKLPDNSSWTARSTGKTKYKNGHSSGVKITLTGSGKIKLDDLSAGFFEANGIRYKMAAELELSCDAQIVPVKIESDFGECQVEGGTWNSETNTLTIRWRIAKNGLNEVSTFQL